MGRERSEKRGGKKTRKVNMDSEKEKRGIPGGVQKILLLKGGKRGKKRGVEAEKLEEKGGLPRGGGCCGGENKNTKTKRQRREKKGKILLK